MVRSTLAALALVTLCSLPLEARSRKPPVKVNLEELIDGGHWRAVAWLDQRLALARSGHREIVRLPIAIRSLGWGCPCPHAFIGTSPDTDMLSLGWLDLSGPGAGDVDELTEGGDVFLAEGWFDGESERKDLRQHPDGPEHHVYTLHGFHVARARPLREDEEPPLEVVLRPLQTCETVTPLRDDRPWFVMVGSAPLSAPNHRKRAEKLAAKVRKAGFEDVEIIDSRRADKMWCCAEVVVAGRFATKDEAKARAKQLKRRRLKAYVKRGFSETAPEIHWPTCELTPAPAAAPKPAPTTSPTPTPVTTPIPMPPPTTPIPMPPPTPTPTAAVPAVVFVAVPDRDGGTAPRLLPLACLDGGRWKPGMDCAAKLPNPIPVQLASGGRVDARLLGDGRIEPGVEVLSDANGGDRIWDYAVWPPERGASLVRTTPAGAATKRPGDPTFVKMSVDDEDLATRFMDEEYGPGALGLRTVVEVDLRGDGRPERFFEMVHAVEPEHHTELYILAYAPGTKPTALEQLTVGEPHQSAQVDAVCDLDGDGQRELVLGIRGQCDNAPATLFLEPLTDDYRPVHAIGPCSVETN